MAIMAQNRISEPEDRVLLDGLWKHGRFYGTWRRDKYLFPIDSEETNRLDIFHKVFLLVRQNRPFHVPITRPRPKIMDLGTGTGIWAINVAEQYFPEGGVMIVDINKIQPALIPVGVIPRQFDIEEPHWRPLWTDCDFIHMRMLLGSLETKLWPQTYRNIFEHLAPGIGHMEHIEVDWTPRWDDDTRPPNPVFTQWAELFYSGMDQYGRSARVRPLETRRMIEAAGFTEFREEVIKVFLSPWADDRREREVARWFNLGLSHSLEALSFMPLVEKLGMKYVDVCDLCSRVKMETCILRYHTYCTIHVWTARKPGPPQ